MPYTKAKLANLHFCVRMCRWILFLQTSSLHRAHFTLCFPISARVWYVFLHSHFFVFWCLTKFPFCTSLPQFGH